MCCSANDELERDQILKQQGTEGKGGSYACHPLPFRAARKIGKTAAAEHVEKWRVGSKGNASTALDTRGNPELESESEFSD